MTADHDLDHLYWNHSLWNKRETRAPVFRHETRNILWLWQLHVTTRQQKIIKNYIQGWTILICLFTYIKSYTYLLTWQMKMLEVT